MLSSSSSSTSPSSSSSLQLGNLQLLASEDSDTLPPPRPAADPEVGEAAEAAEAAAAAPAAVSNEAEGELRRVARVQTRI